MPCTIKQMNDCTLSPEPDIAVVVIGRNEGARLVASLASLKGVVSQIVYVDSGSTDDSLQVAREAGARVVELDLSIPFTAARARNAGFEALDPMPEFVQFIDGDCMVEPGWISLGLDTISKHQEIGIVTGWRSEIHPDASVYNDMVDFEWHRPPGEITLSGGDFIVRSKTFLEVGGFNPGLIAGEDDEFCLRVGRAGWRLHRLPVNMTKHDANMIHFGQWWRRAVRAGHAYAQVGSMHSDYAPSARVRILVFGAVLPFVALIALFTNLWLLLPVVCLYLLSYARTVLGLKREGLRVRKALHHSVFLSLSKLPNLIGFMTYYWRKFRGNDMVLIEYK